MSDPFSSHIWKLAHDRQIELGQSSVLMGILNVTPDSFSDGGKFDGLDGIVSYARQMTEEGAAIIDIGGESTRPGANPVTAKQEQDRILPVIEALADEEAMILSVDTYRAETAKLAIDAGAHIINDVWGFQKDPQLAGVAAMTGAGVCAMHTGRERKKESDVIKDQLRFFQHSLQILETAGVKRDRIVLDPGFGFAKNEQENVNLLARLEQLQALGFPMLIGTSRKRFIGHITGRDTENRDIGTAATSVVARMKGGAVFRVHDVPSNRDALAVADAIRRAK